MNKNRVSREKSINILSKQNIKRKEQNGYDFGEFIGYRKEFSLGSVKDI